MKEDSYLFTSESVSEGHPDKLCDRVSDAILDLYLRHDPHARVACETLATTNRLIVAGEVRSAHAITQAQIEEVARAAVKNIGYEQEGFHWRTLEFSNYLHEQSADIARGVDQKDAPQSQGAGDQGIMFGYACRDYNDALMPAPLYYAHRILQSLARARHEGEVNLLEPDAKSQVTLRYEGGKAVGATSVVVSTQHAEDASQQDIRALVKDHVAAVLPEGWMCDDDQLYVNPTGRFVIGGPDGDAGLTGRKIVVDTYGGAAPHGGGAFSGKDPSKVDRSAAYMARYLAKNVVASELATRCTIQLAYAIGVAQPLAVYVNSHGTARVSDVSIARTLQETMDLSPHGIQTHLQLARPIYERTASYGHFGRTPDADGGFSWEQVNLAPSLAKRL